MKNPIKSMWVTLAAALIMAAGMNCAGSQQSAQTTTAARPAATPASARPAAPAASAPAAQTAPVAKTTAANDELDIAIRDASDCLNDNIPKGSKIVILNIESNSANLSEYIIDELIANAIKDKNFSVVDRRQLEAIQSEQKFQMSGAVDDKDALEIGKFFGAQTIVSGAMREMGGRYRMTVRALSVQTAVVQSQCNQNITTANSATLTDLANSGGGRPSGAATAASGGASQTTLAPSAVTSVGGSIAVSNVSTWNTAINSVRNGGNDKTYVIDIKGNVSVPALPKDENIFGAVTGITVTIRGKGTLSLSVGGCLLRIGAGQTVILRDVTLKGRSDNNTSLVVIMSGSILRMESQATVTGNTGRGVLVDGGNFIMQDRASVSGNTRDYGDWKQGKNGVKMVGDGGGVYVAGGTFTMQGSATVSANTVIGCDGGMVCGDHNISRGGGVYVGKGTFIMQSSASVSGNNAKCGGNYHGSSKGGGVFVSPNGVFIMEGGIISGNTANKYSESAWGGGVFVDDGGKFTLVTGTISHNTANGGGGGVDVGGKGTFTMQGGMIFGNNARDGYKGNGGVGGGVGLGPKAIFIKTGGAINGNDAVLANRNTAAKQGHAVYYYSERNSSSPTRWRNATAGPDDKTDDYGFWLND